MRWRRFTGEPLSFVDEMWRDHPWTMRRAALRYECLAWWQRLTGRWFS